VSSTRAGAAADIEERLALALRAIGHTAAGLDDEFPHVTEAGRWKTLRAGDRPSWQGSTWRHGNWTGGFWVGCLWLAAMLQSSGDRDHSRFAAQARRWAARLSGREHDDATHDLGFLFYPSHAVGAMRGEDGVLTQRALTAAGTLLTRLVERPAGGASLACAAGPGGGRRSCADTADRGSYLQAWGPRGHPDWIGTSTIDTMMNLPLLWWAARTAGDRRFAEAAAAHARTTRRNFFRPDGSTYHLVRYGRTAADDQRTTFQGYSPESCWARGQAWAIAGFAVAYRETGDEDFLAAAETAADYFLRRLPPDRVPYWDFDDPAIPDAPRDSSAGAIVADGLLELSAAHPCPARAARWRAEAAALFDAVGERCQNGAPEETAGVLLHGCYSRPHNEGVDAALTWGDYFYLHALGWLAIGRRPEAGG
jgi:unsaturated chondroitin disaccharide hydrolase